MNLVPAIKSIEQQITEIKSRHAKELKPYEDSLASLRKLNTACEACNGTGQRFRRACAEDEGEYYICDECLGTGRKEE